MNDLSFVIKPPLGNHGNGPTNPNGSLPCPFPDAFPERIVIQIAFQSRGKCGRPQPAHPQPIRSPLCGGSGSSPTPVTMATSLATSPMSRPDSNRATIHKRVPPGWIRPSATLAEKWESGNHGNASHRPAPIDTNSRELGGLIDSG